MVLSIKRVGLHNLPHHLSYDPTLPDITQKETYLSQTDRASAAHTIGIEDICKSVTLKSGLEIIQGN